MADIVHTAQERYSALVDKKLRATIVTKDGVIFNTRYEGNPKAGAVKIPVRDTEVAVAAYNKKSGADVTHGQTDYLTVAVDKDYAVNELIDGFDAESVPDNLVADRLDSAGYALALRMDTDAVAELVKGGTVAANTTPLTDATVYNAFVDERTALSKAHIPADNRRWALVSPDTFAHVLKSPEFISATDLGDAVKQTGALGQIAGFNIYECSTLPADVEYIVGHPDWCHRIPEWAVPVHLQDLSGSGKYIGASAVQGRKIYAHKVSKKVAVRVKKAAAAAE